MDELEVSALTTRRKFLGATGVALAGATVAPVLGAQQAVPPQQGSNQDHNAPNERQPGANNTPLDNENPDSVWPPETDHGTVKPFKYSFSTTHKRIESGGWTRQVTQRELPIATSLSGVEMKLTKGGVRELHWHPSAEWAL